MSSDLERTTESILAYRDGFAEHENIHSIRLIKTEVAEPLVSIMIPTFRRPELLRESIASALTQNVTVPYEVIVVDNDHENTYPIKGIVEEFASPMLGLYRNESNIGMFGNWNRCLQLARGRWVTILNDDDMISPDFLSECLAILQSKHAFLVACSSSILDQRKNGQVRSIKTAVKCHLRILFDRMRKKVSTYHVEDYFISNRHWGSLGVLMDRETALKLGGYDSRCYPSADYVFLVRFVLEKGSLLFLRKKLAIYRINQNESQKPELLRGWVSQGLKLRGELARHIHAPARLLSAYSEMSAIQNVRNYKLFWSPEFDSAALLAELGLSDRNVSFRLRLATGVLRIAMALRTF